MLGALRAQGIPVRLHGFLAQGVQTESRQHQPVGRALGAVSYKRPNDIRCAAVVALAVATIGSRIWVVVDVHRTQHAIRTGNTHDNHRSAIRQLNRHIGIEQQVGTHFLLVV